MTDIWDDTTPHRIKGKIVRAPSILIRESGGWKVPGMNAMHLSLFADSRYHGLANVSMLAAARYAAENINRGSYDEAESHILSTPFPDYAGYVIVENDMPVLWIEFDLGYYRDHHERIKIQRRLGPAHKIKAKKFDEICMNFYRYYAWLQSRMREWHLDDASVMRKVSYLEERSKPFFMHMDLVSDRAPKLSDFYRLVGYEFILSSYSKPYMKHWVKH